MKQIADIIPLNKFSTQSGTPVARAPHAPESSEPCVKHFDSEKWEVIELMFLKLSAIYGNAWRNLYKNSDFLTFAKEEWFDALSEFSENTIHRAISICAEHNKFPPSLHEFMTHCKSTNREKSFFQAEPYEKGSPELATNALSRIKTILNRSGGATC